MNSLDGLALFGGTPEFTEPLHVGRPNQGDKASFLKRAEAILERNWLSNDGPEVRQFEQAICDYTGADYAVAMCNATIALEIAIRAVGLSGEVIVPSFTFVATAHALQWQEITPVFADVAENSHNVDPAAVENMITPRTTGILATHVWGIPCQVEALQEVADRFGLTLLFDAAHAFGAEHHGQMIGNFGRAEVFSFHATKVLNSFEGGAIVTNDGDLASSARFMRNFGFSGVDHVGSVGTNGKMTEIAAAMGLTSLEAFSTFKARGKSNFNAYRDELRSIPGLSVLDQLGDDGRNYHYIVVEVDETETGLSRDELCKALWLENVLARRYFYPGVHQMEPYRSLFPHAKLLLPRTERLTSRVMTLPNGMSIDVDDIKRIGALIATLCEHSEQVRAALHDETARSVTS
jgi:dTDP-4-amino-4,6-dideoxygalactose transaminase